jgi:anti-sigma factor RsiW
MRELAWRRKLSPAEAAELESWLAAHPAITAQWREEAALNAALDQLPDAPVPSNFTARILSQIERETAATAPHKAAIPWWRRPLIPRLAFAAVVVGAGLFAYQRHLALENVRGVGGVLISVQNTRDMLSLEVLQDFDSIAELGPRIQPDTELLSLLQ